MSEIYLGELKSIQKEFEAVHAVLRYGITFWHTDHVMNELSKASDISLKFMLQANQGVEHAYIVRLYAGFKGILRSHLLSNHPAVLLPMNAKVDWLLNRVAMRERLTIGSVMRKRLDLIRITRNAIAHKDMAVTLMTFNDAAAVLRTVVGRLQDPLK